MILSLLVFQQLYAMPPDSQKRNSQKRNSRREDSPTQNFRKEKAAWIFGSVTLGAIFLIFFKEQLTNDQRSILRFLIAMCSSMLSFFLSGTLTVKLEAKGQVINAGMGLGVFVLLMVVVDPTNAKLVVAQSLPSAVPKSDKLEEAQTLLKKAGLYSGSPTGVQSKGFSDAVTRWQKEIGKEQTGFIEAEDLPSLRNYLKSSDPKSGRPVGSISEPVLYRNLKTDVNWDGPAGARLKLPPQLWQPQTTLRNLDGSSIDAEALSIVTVPLDHQSVETILAGDFAVVYNLKKDILAYAQLGDSGPRQGSNNKPRSFEVSPKLADILKVNRDWRNGGAGPGEIACIIFPRSGPRTAVSEADIQREAGRWFEQWGGLKKLQALLVGAH